MSFCLTVETKSNSVNEEVFSDKLCFNQKHLFHLNVFFQTIRLLNGGSLLYVSNSPWHANSLRLIGWKSFNSIDFHRQAVATLNDHCSNCLPSSNRLILYQDNRFQLFGYLRQIFTRRNCLQQMIENNLLSFVLNICFCIITGVPTGVFKLLSYNMVSSCSYVFFFISYSFVSHVDHFYIVIFPHKV